MDTSKKLSYFLIGEGTFLLQCVEILLDREQTLYGIISSDAAVRDGARERDISHRSKK
jgi:hypothetical protein